MDINKFIFDPHSRPLDLIQFCVKDAIEFIFIGPSHSKQSKYHEQLIGLEPPSFPFLKLNIDGSSLGNPSTSGAVAVIKNHWGEWLMGFSRHLDFASNNLVEA
ncbi:hypothetical protein ACH5RR_003583 [Cinchona calisaya]|uniref:RNase H type-1 domain-containing protein n=1 Tax=Cinchona calisaya TaxID=153742 RepID=A0ABD3AVY4_9GENT